jgi:hypothetical protein
MGRSFDGLIALIEQHKQAIAKEFDDTTTRLCEMLAKHLGAASYHLRCDGIALGLEQLCAASQIGKHNDFIRLLGDFQSIVPIPIRCHFVEPSNTNADILAP